MKLKCSFIILILIVFCNVLSAQQTKDTMLSIYYKSNEWQLDSNNISSLNSQLKSIVSIHKMEVFTDSVGSTKANDVLAFKRGETVKNYFIQHQFNPKILTKYFGEKHSMDDVFSSNRRTDIYYTLKIDEPVKPPVDSIVLVLENIFFIADKSIVETSSIAYLETLVMQLKAYKAKRFEIIGHTNQRGNHYYELSIQRAKTIYEYLVENGIPADKLSYLGVGNTRKLIENPNTIAEMKKNMRVEIVVRF